MAGDLEVASLTESSQRYLEAIYILEHTGGAIAARVAERLAVRAPSVTQALRRLEATALLTVAPDRTLHLTTAGTSLAEQVMRRHRVLERWLVEGLGLDWAQAHGEAQRMEHAVSTEVVDRLYRAMGQPTTCPHGNPIPGRAGLPPYAGSLTLDQAPPGTAGRVARIAEDAEESVDALVHFDRLALRPGTLLLVLANTSSSGAASGGTVGFRVGENSHTLSQALAAQVWIDLAET